MLQMNRFQYENNIRVLLKKIEDGINKKDNINLLFVIYKGYTENIDDIINIIKNEFEKKQELMNELAVFFYNSKQYEDTLSLLNASFALNPKNNDTLYNLGYILYQLNENEIALGFLNKIQYKNSETIQLIEEVKNKMQECN